MNIKKTTKVMSYELDCVKRQVGHGCDRNCRDCDLALSDDLVIDAFETVMDILRAQQKAEKNEPLTLEELGVMHGEPVYVTIQYENETPTKVWMLVHAWDEETVFLVDVFGDERFAEDPCIKEIYRRPPEGGVEK